LQPPTHHPVSLFGTPARLAREDGVLVFDLGLFDLWISGLVRPGDPARKTTTST